MKFAIIESLEPGAAVYYRPLIQLQGQILNHLATEWFISVKLIADWNCSENSTLTELLLGWSNLKVNVYIRIWLMKHDMAMRIMKLDYQNILHVLVFVTVFSKHNLTLINQWGIHWDVPSQFVHLIRKIRSWQWIMFKLVISNANDVNQHDSLWFLKESKEGQKNL